MLISINLKLPNDQGTICCYDSKDTLEQFREKVIARMKHKGVTSSDLANGIRLISHGTEFKDKTGFGEFNEYVRSSGENTVHIIYGRPQSQTTVSMLGRGGKSKPADQLQASVNASVAELVTEIKQAGGDPRALITAALEKLSLATKTAPASAAMK